MCAINFPFLCFLYKYSRIENRSWLNSKRNEKTGNKK